MIVFRNELHYIVPITAVTSTIQHGILSFNAACRLNHDTIANQIVQKRRAAVKVPNGLDLHDYVNLYFDARNPMMYSRKEKVDTICVLRVADAVLNIPGTVITDSNASSDYVRFYPSPAGLQSIDFQLIYSEDWRDRDEIQYYLKKSRKCAEVLVPHCVPFMHVTGVYVGSESAKQALENSSLGLTIILSPIMFFAE
ncbi:MAG: DUF4433 domain-containing protein [Candidatus Cloacimonadaceae bacterium]|nr:DUF4433 domain-containing protein [Candidatus Cloacimonadaceae bacterium]